MSKKIAIAVISSLLLSQSSGFCVDANRIRALDEQRNEVLKQITAQLVAGKIGPTDAQQLKTGLDTVMQMETNAQEVMTPALVSEIQDTLSSDLIFKYDGFAIPRMLYVGEQAVKHGGFYPDAHLRLFRRGKGRFKECLVHESLVVDGPIKRLKHELKNRAYDTVEEYRTSLENFARLYAKQKLKEGYNTWQSHPLNEFLHPYWTFFYKFIVRRGFMDGKLGLDLALIYSHYVACKIRYLRKAVTSNSVNQ